MSQKRFALVEFDLEVPEEVVAPEPHRDQAATKERMELPFEKS